MTLRLNRHGLVVFAFLILGVVRFAEADPLRLILYDNGPLLIAAGAGSGPGFKIADQFVSPESFTVYGLNFWGSYISGLSPGQPPATDHFVFELYGHDFPTGRPGPLVEVQSLDVRRSSTGLVNPQGFTIYQYEAEVEPFPIWRYETYWISVHNDTVDPLLWFWTYSGAAGSLAMKSAFAGGDWFIPATYGNLSFQFIPEPPVAAMLGLATIAVVLRRRAVSGDFRSVGERS